ncbi:polyphosphate polymerase domain-containing protein [Paenibacillus arenilitoris]|uniref:Polyphosphate polymerase domain-containing protein n=1 Tax=Paenibacillus arenilitoris TaxID=2772299 RepID=A0A927HAK2_9BACL|nr:polyphosphate polymerase domain-containing protein [Paenibacillus arenilitoris]MBD2872689.1 polyphosphate polymerase domain-containing protein [Paenibacillus arenilitoris]
MNNKLKYRNELKFFVNHHQYYVIRQRLKGLMKPDKHAGPTGEYHIRSLYFDDIDNKALHEKLGGIRDRVKYRIRIYNGCDGVIHFEKKIKFKDYIAKVKEPLTRAMYDELLTGRYEVLKEPDRPLLHEIHDEMKHNLLRPKVIVDYVREPYVCERGNVRITFDKELRTGLHAVDIFDRSLSTVRAIDNGLIILEVKFDEYIPAYIRTALQLEGLNRQSASKYVICRKYLKLNAWEDY